MTRFGTTNHLRSYWSPRMRAMFTERLEHGAEGLDELPCEALRFLKDRADFKPIQRKAATPVSARGAFGNRPGMS
jgi:hypothetical protein